MDVMVVYGYYGYVWIIWFCVDNIVFIWITWFSMDIMVCMDNMVLHG